MTLTTHRVDTDPLYDVCLSLAALVQKNKYAIDGSLLAHLAKRLIIAEVRPGGPYRNEAGEVDAATNLAVGYLFLCIRKPLPAVVQFIEKLPEADKLSVPLYKKYLTLLASYVTPPLPKAEQIYTRIEASLAKLDAPVRDSAISFLARVKSADKHYEITLLADRFHQSLLTPKHSHYTTTLGEANVYCWIAYTIYDHLIDGEKVINYLPVANIATRLSIERYSSIFPVNHPFLKTIQRVFTAMDSANAWELTYCRLKATPTHLSIDRLPLYRQRHILARRSFGHTLGPLALASLAGGTAAQLADIRRGLSHYLITRQLNDDMHDWRQDLREGHVSPVIALLLRQAGITQGTYAIETLSEMLTPLFWSKTVTAMNKTIHDHAEAAKRHLRRSRLLKDDTVFYELITRLDQMALSAPQAHAQYQGFLTTVKHIL